MSEMETITGDLMGAIQEGDDRQAAKCLGEFLRIGLESLARIAVAFERMADAHERLADDAEIRIE